MRSVAELKSRLDAACGGRGRTSGDVLLATFPAAGDDGVEASIWGSAWPARFYEVRAYEGLEIATGSSCEQLAIDVASNLASGMLVIRPAAGRQS